MDRLSAGSSYGSYPVRSGSLTEMEYAPSATTFTLWAPTADEVRLMIYSDGWRGSFIASYAMMPAEEGTWKMVVAQDLLGKYYTFHVKVKGKWLGETPGINAQAVGVNGQRAAIVDWKQTHPEGWDNDRRPPLQSPADMIIYEMHHRDFSVDEASGICHKGKYLALTEQGTTNSFQLATGIDHLVELGVTHVHLLPSSDYASIDETRLDENPYNWGYDPRNYNVPDGSYATDPYQPETRIREFKQMVLALHRAGIRVVMDMVYNHTFYTEESNFERTVPGYFYRRMKDGSWSNGSGCGNETASERPMMRKFMIDSVLYWIREYHIDGFRFDLMGLHDIDTMNAIRKAVDEVDSSVCLYGEGWTGGVPCYPASLLALKMNVARMPGIAAFSDELRDALCGSVWEKEKGGFLAGVPGAEQSVKFGIVGAIAHPQVKYRSVNYSHLPWAAQPTQMIGYVSCHDGLCLADRLKAALPDVGFDELVRLDKLAQTVVLTSQGIPFLYAGEELMRDKQGVDNSYKSPDAINGIAWDRKFLYRDVFAYYKELILLRKSHPAFRMGDAALVCKHLRFLPVKGRNLIAYCLHGQPNGESWKDIVVAFNARSTPARLQVPAGLYRVVCKDGVIDLRGLGVHEGSEVIVPGQSALIMYKN
ncbi:type I pullulanase [uncultured Bacteroides sp.]|jgi:pullulanase|uniref:type I pullulanase n=1 Tax=uncultured Bacteroides sp. TaxID=162156 RepID=UPI0025DB7763|nr:type I pullulanase [uncultured Bacteroides sp.]